MKFRWRNRPSATVWHLRVLMTLGLALPASISLSSPALSMGARQPVIAVLACALMGVLRFLCWPDCAARDRLANRQVCLRKAHARTSRRGKGVSCPGVADSRCDRRGMRLMSGLEKLCARCLGNGHRGDRLFCL